MYNKCVALPMKLHSRYNAVLFYPLEYIIRYPARSNVILTLLGTNQGYQNFCLISNF